MHEAKSDIQKLTNDMRRVVLCILLPLSHRNGRTATISSTQKAQRGEEYLEGARETAYYHGDATESRRKDRKQQEEDQLMADLKAMVVKSQTERAEVSFPLGGPKL